MSNAPAAAPAAEEKLPEEPVFILRGRDAGTDEALITYRQRAKDLGSSEDHLKEIDEKIAAFRDFPVSVVPGIEKVGSKPGSSIKKPEPAKA